MLRCASLFFLSVFALSCVLSSLHYAKDSFLKILTFKNTLLISIQND